MIDESLLSQFEDYWSGLVLIGSNKVTEHGVLKHLRTKTNISFYTNSQIILKLKLA